MGRKGTMLAYLCGMFTLPPPVHHSLHVLGALYAAGWGILAQPEAVAPWVCLATHALGASRWRTTTPASEPAASAERGASDGDILPTVRVSLGIVAVLISAGQHWVLGVTGLDFVLLASASLVLEAVRPRA